MNVNKIDSAVKAALIADSYLIGSHWVYDVVELQNLDVDWDELNAPSSQWHKGKEKGDFTHYGDHALWLDTFVKENASFDVNAYSIVWLDKMQSYKGYIDGSCKDTLEILGKDSASIHGSSSSDLSIVGSISPLLYVSKNKSEFLSYVESYIAFTHNNERVLKVAQLFASILYDVIEGSTISDAINSVRIDKSLQEAFDAAKVSKDELTLETIHQFGHGCPVEGGFESTLHILLKHSDYKEAMIANAKCGGDSASRGMIVGMIMGASNYDIPQSWIDGTKGLQKLEIK